MPKVMVNVRSTLMPISRAACRSWVTARIDLPISVRFRNTCSAIAVTVSVAKITSRDIVTRMSPTPNVSPASLEGTL